MPTGDCARAHAHQSPAELDADVVLLKRIDWNHCSVPSDVVQTSKLGPVARYNGMRAVSTLDRKRRVVVGITGVDARSWDASVISNQALEIRAMQTMPLHTLDVCRVRK